MEHIGEKIVEVTEVPILDEDGNETGEFRIKKTISWGLPKGVSGPYYDESITDADRLAEAWYEFRSHREVLLRKVDVYQGVLVYNTLTEEQQTELATYRQALLDLPNNYDTPEKAYENIPAKPSWID